MLCNVVCILLYPVWGVGHGRAQGSVADHGEVVETVANGNGFGRGKGDLTVKSNVLGCERTAEMLVGYIRSFMEQD